MSILNITEALTAENVKPEYVVDGFLYRGQMVSLAGEAGVGKSFLMTNLSMCIATGLPFLGMPVNPGRVLYFDEENSKPDAQEYLRWAWRGLNKPSMALVEQNIRIEHFSLAQHGAKRFKAMVDISTEFSPSLIVIDTATPVCDIRDENDNAEASRVITRLRAVKEAAGTDAAMVVLKHAKVIQHDEEQVRTVRGAKAWLGALDGTLYHSLPPGQPRKDGLRNTRLEQDKIRAFGLRSKLKIIPQKLADGGVVLHAEIM